MPRIPQVSVIEPQFPRQSISAAELPGEALAQAGSAVTDLGQEALAKQVELARSRQIMEKTSQAALAANDVYENTLQDPNLPNEQLSSTVQKGLKAVHDKIAKDIKDPEVSLHFDQNFAGLTVQHIVNAEAKQSGREIEASVATLNSSNQTLAGLAAEHTGQQQDADVAQIEGNLSGAVAKKEITAEQAQAESRRLREVIYTAKYDKQIRENPAQAFLDLQTETNLDPVKKQNLINQALEGIKSLSDAADLQRKQAIESEATNFALDANANNGKATFSRLADFVKKYSTGGEPVPQATADKLFDLITSPPRNVPSDQNVLWNARVAVGSTPPRVTQQDLNNLYNGGHGSINKTDWGELSVSLEKNRREPNEQRSMTEKIITAEFGGDPQVHAEALKALDSGSSLAQIEGQYKPLMQNLGGLSRAAAIGQFNSARNSFASALASQRNWESGIHPIKHLGENPYDASVIDRREDLLNKAHAAGKILRSVSPGTIEGAEWTQPDGVHVMAIGGKVIAQ